MACAPGDRIGDPRDTGCMRRIRRARSAQAEAAIHRDQETQITMYGKVNPSPSLRAPVGRLRSRPIAGVRGLELQGRARSLNDVPGCVAWRDIWRNCLYDFRLGLWSSPRRALG